MIRIIAGPPGSGKTTYVQKHMIWGDLVLDVDRLFEAVSLQPSYDKPAALLPLVMSLRQNIILQIRRGYPRNTINTWLIGGYPKADERNKVANLVNADEVIVFEFSVNECLKHIANDPRRSERMNQWEPIIRNWWNEYTRSSTDRVIRPIDINVEKAGSQGEAQ